MKAKAIILAAGQGTRMKSPLPKVMHKLAGRTMIKTLLDTLSEIETEDSVVVVGPDMDCVKQEVNPIQTVEQTERLGTGHAVKQASAIFDDYPEGCFFVLYGDTPLISARTLQNMYDAFQNGADIVVLGFEPPEPGRYGRLIEKDGVLAKITEYKDATEEERAIRLCNSGVMCVSGKELWHLIGQLKNENAAGEYYLTDIVELGNRAGLKAVVTRGDNEELLGVNSRADLSVAEKVVQRHLRQKALENGVTLEDADSVHFSYDTEIDPNVTVEPDVYFGEGVKIHSDATIHAFSYLENVEVGSEASVGPFARIRGKSVIGEKAKIGNFVEVKNSSLGYNTKASHLSYLGDACLGDEVNIGAGTITCNYDGHNKSQVRIGSRSFIGSDTVMVAPLEIGEGAITGAGSVLTTSVPADALAVTRPKLLLKENWAEAYHQRKLKGKK